MGIGKIYMRIKKKNSRLPKGNINIEIEFCIYGIEEKTGNRP